MPLCHRNQAQAVASASRLQSSAVCSFGKSLRWGFIVLLLACPIAVSAADVELLSQDPPTAPFFRGPVPRSAAIINDATLNDVCAMGQQVWAAGERGVVLRSDDGGRTWQEAVLSIECSLQSIHFLTNRIGFLAGIQPDQIAGGFTGVLLITRDGGMTWSRLGDVAALPGLQCVRFFDLQNGYVVTLPGDGNGGQILRTKDGGATWNELTADTENPDWSRVVFLGSSEGIALGHRLSWGLINSGQLVPQSTPRRTMQSVRAASISQDGQAWLVGDGGLVRYSSRRGIGWAPAAGQFPRAIRDVFRFNTVVHSGLRVCIAGTPANCVLRSHDQGLNWQLIPCAQGGSIKRLVRVGEDVLLAVGSWGMIHRSDDFGASWKAVRNADHRAALMTLVTEPQDQSPVMLATVAGNGGYRVTTVQPSVSMSVTDVSRNEAARLSLLGGGAMEKDWRFPRTRRGTEMSQNGALHTWNQTTDGRAEELLPLRLALQIRTWRPSVISLESSSALDELPEIWQTALSDAMLIAAGHHPRSAELDELGIQRWAVQRVVRRVHDAVTPLQYKPDRLLGALATTASLLADWWHIQNAQNHSAATAAFYTLVNGGEQTPRDMFRGTAAATDKHARRRMSVPATTSDQLQTAVTQHQAVQAAVASQSQRSPHGLELIASLETLGEGLPETLRLAQLRNALQRYSETENLNGRIAILKEFARRSPGTTEGVSAVAELHRIYSSSEITALRGAEKRGQTEIQQAISVRNESRPSGVQITSVAGTNLPRIQGTPRELAPRTAWFRKWKPSRGLQSQEESLIWNRQADHAWNLLEQWSPQTAQSASYLLIRAAQVRRHGKPGQEQSILASAAGSKGPHQLLATNEMQATFYATTPALPVFTLPEASERPQLDGILSDACWARAPEIRLREDESPPGTPQSMLLVSWDGDFIFLAGQLPVIAAQLPSAEAIDRNYDEADITTDHVAFSLDVDRDYATAWHFVIDSSGRTSEHCAGTTRWNPHWFVATWRDEQEWHFEAAIPVSQVNDQPLRFGQMWAFNARRIVPGYADHRLPTPPAARQLETRYSLLRFIRNRLKTP